MVLELVNGDVSNKEGYLIAIEKNEYSKATIDKLNALNNGADSICVLTPESIKGLKYHY